MLSSLSLELVGRFVNGTGLMTQLAPREVTLKRENVQVVMDEVFELLNFTIAEAQRLLFARNVKHTSVAFGASFVAYNLVKVLPLWGLSMVSLVIAFTGPPMYLRHQAAIDEQISRATELGSAHFEKVKQQASKSVEVYSERARAVAVELGEKAGVVKQQVKVETEKNKQVNFQPVEASAN